MRKWVPQVYIAQHYGISARTIRKWAKENATDLEVLRYRGYVFYDLHEFDAVVKKMQEKWRV